MNDLPKTHDAEQEGADESAYLQMEKPSVFRQIRQWMRGSLGHKYSDSSLKEALEEVLEGHQEEGAALPSEEKTIIKNILSFGDILVRDIMISRTHIVAVEDTVSLEDLKRHIIEQRHTRIPVYHGTLDDVRGFIHIKDLVAMLSGDETFDIVKILRQILFVPPSMKVVDLLLRLRLSGLHMAIVVDEFGGTDGLVTMEDVFEEIVGEIQDEHDEMEERPALHWINSATWEADGRARVEDIEEQLEIRLVGEDETVEFDTLGGLIFDQLGRVPAKGEVIEHPSGVKFEIIDADPRRIRKVRIVKFSPAAAAVEAS